MSNSHRDKQRWRMKRRERITDADWVQYCRWPQQEPSWWHSMTTHTPARAKERQLLHKRKRDPESEDGNWPDRRKPHLYYW